MRWGISFLVCILFHGISFGQDDSTDLVPLWKDPNKKEVKVHVDSASAYQVRIPEWLELITFSQEDVWGGLMPDTFGVRNAVVIRSYPKDSFENFSAFTMYVYGHVQPAKRPVWNRGFVCVSKKQIPDYQFLGYQAYQLELMRNGKSYYTDCILLETTTSYIWIDYTSTEETHNVNQVLMFEFLRGFRRI